MKDKKFLNALVWIVLVINLILSSTLLIRTHKPSDGVKRNDEAFSSSTIEALRKNIEEETEEKISELTSLSGTLYWYKGFWFEAFSDENNKIYCAVFDSRRIENELRYVSIKYFDFTDNEITEETGTKYYNAFYDAFSKQNLIFGIMPAEHSGILINDSLQAYILPIEVNGKQYNCWLAIFDGKIDKLKSVEYA